MLKVGSREHGRDLAARGNGRRTRGSRIRPRGPESGIATWTAQLREIPLLSGVGRGILGLIARVGLALFLTAGFAGALVLYAGMTPSSPNVIRACEGFFFWSLALISCTMGE